MYRVLLSDLTEHLLIKIASCRIGHSSIKIGSQAGGTVPFHNRLMGGQAVKICSLPKGEVSRDIREDIKILLLTEGVEQPHIWYQICPWAMGYG